MISIIDQAGIGLLVFVATLRKLRARDIWLRPDVIIWVIALNMKAWRQAKLHRMRRLENPDPCGLAQLCARLGYVDETFVHLDRAYRDRNNSLIRLLYLDCWDPLRQDPRFQAFLEKVGYRR